MVDPLGALDFCIRIGSSVKQLFDNYVDLKDQLSETLTSIKSLEQGIRKRMDKGQKSFLQQDFMDFLQSVMNTIEKISSDLQNPNRLKSFVAKLRSGEKLADLASLNLKLEERRKNLLLEVQINSEDYLRALATRTNTLNELAQGWWDRYSLPPDANKATVRSGLRSFLLEKGADNYKLDEILDFIANYLDKKTGSGKEKISNFVFKDWNKLAGVEDHYKFCQKKLRDGKVLSPGVFVAAAIEQYVLDGQYKKAMEELRKNLDFDYKEDPTLLEMGEEILKRWKETGETKLNALDTEAKEVAKKLTEVEIKHYYTLKIVEAKKIKAADLGGTTDAYIKVYLGKEKIHETEVLLKFPVKTSNPKWENNIVQFSSKKPEGEGDVLIELWDQNKIGKDEKLGTIKLDCRAAPRTSLAASAPGIPFEKGGGEIVLELSSFCEFNELKKRGESLPEEMKKTRESLEDSKRHSADWESWRARLHHEKKQEEEKKVAEEKAFVQSFSSGPVELSEIMKDKKVIDREQLCLYICKKQEIDFASNYETLQNIFPAQMNEATFAEFKVWFPFGRPPVKNVYSNSDPDPAQNSLLQLINLDRFEWFFGNIGSPEAAKSLEKQAVSTFLIRFSVNNPGCYALAMVGSDSQVKHLKINNRAIKDPHGVVKHEYTVPPETVAFPCLEDLVKYYTKNVLPSVGLTFGTACPGRKYPLVYFNK